MEGWMKKKAKPVRDCEGIEDACAEDGEDDLDEAKRQDWDDIRAGFGKIEADTKEHDDMEGEILRFGRDRAAERS